jgi:transcriptional regulator with XRE-family HTH domain
MVYIIILGGNFMPIGDRIKDLRTDLGLSRQYISEHLGISPSTVNMIERNERLPSVELLEKIADFFSVSVDYLLFRTDIKDAYTRSNRDPLDEILVKIMQRDAKPITVKKKRKLLKIIEHVYRIVEDDDDKY